MKIHTKVVYQLTDEGMDLLEDNWQEYYGEISKCGSGGGNTTTVQKSDPWSGVQPYLTGQAGQEATPGTEGYWTGLEEGGKGTPQWVPGTPGTPAQQAIPGIFPEAMRLFQGPGPQYFPGSTVAPTSQGTQQAWQQGMNLATGGAPQAIQDTASGNYLQGSPFLQAQLKQLGEGITSKVNSQFSGAGRFGSGLHAGELGGQIAGATTNLLGQNYMAERARQMDAANQLQNIGYQNVGLLGQIGQQQQAQQQAQIGDQVARHDFGQNAPWNQLQRYASFISPGAGIGGTTTMSQPYFNNPMAGALGGALGGGMLGSMPGMAWLGGPWGAGIGAALGLLGGSR